MSLRPIQPFPTPQQPDDDGGDKRPVKCRTNTVRVACEACRKAKAKCDGSRPRCQACVSRKKECVYRGDEGQSKEAIMKSRIDVLEQRIRELEAAQSSCPQPGEPEESEESEEPENPSAAGPIIQRVHSSIELTFPSTPIVERAIDGFFSCSGKLFHVFSESQVSHISNSVYSEADSESEDRKAGIGCLMAVAAVGSQYTSTPIDNDIQEACYDIARLYLDAVIAQRPLDAIKVCTLLCMYNVFSKATICLAYAHIGIGICERYGLDCQQRQVDEMTDSMWLDYRRTWRTLIFLTTWLSTTLGFKTGSHKMFEEISPSQLEIGNQSDISEIQTEMAKIAVLKAKILHMHLAFKHLAAESLNLMIQDLQHWYERLPPQTQLQSVLEQDMPLEAKRSIYHVHLLYLGANMLLFRRIVAENIQSRRRDINLSPLWHPSGDLLSKQGPNALLAASSSAKILKLLLDNNGIFKRCWLVIFQSYTSCIIIMHAILTKLVSSSIYSSHRDEIENAALCLETLAYCGSADPVAERFHKKAQAIYSSVLKYIKTHTEVFIGPRQRADDGQNIVSYTNIAENGLSGKSQQGSTHANEEDPGVFPISHHDSIEELSLDLLIMLCRPFGDPSYRESSKESLEATSKSDPSRYEHPELVGRLDWDFENSFPFQWNTEKLGLRNLESMMSGEGSAQNTQPENRFLDSMHPSGWA